MPKLSTTPKLFAFWPDKEGPPLLAIIAASEAEAIHHLRHDLKAIVKLSPGESFELGRLGVPLTYAKAEYRGEAQPELPLAGGEVAHAQP